MIYLAGLLFAAVMLMAFFLYNCDGWFAVFIIFLFFILFFIFFIFYLFILFFFGNQSCDVLVFTGLFFVLPFLFREVCWKRHEWTFECPQSLSAGTYLGKQR